VGTHECPADFATERRGGLTVVGRGIGYASAAEISLKIREVTGIRSEAYSAPDYLHGPIGADGQGATLLVVVTDEMEDEIAASLIEQCSQRGMRTVMLRSFEHSHRRVTPTSWCPESMDNWCLGLALVVVGQVLSLRLANFADVRLILHRDLTKSTHGVTRLQI